MSPGADAAPGVEEETADVVVIGGGPSGLVAALQCARVGLEVLLLERAGRLGGGYAPLDEAAGADPFDTDIRDPSGEVRRWLAELHAPLELVAREEPPSLVRGARPAVLPLPADSILGIPGSPLSPRARALLGGSAAFRAFLERWRPVLSIGAASSLGRLARARMGDAVADVLVEPLVRDRYGVAADDADPAVVVPGLNAALTSVGHLAGAVLAELPVYRDEQGPRRLVGGSAALVRALEADLALFGVRVRRGAEATGVLPADGAGGGRPGARVRWERPVGASDAGASDPGGEGAPAKGVIRCRGAIVAAGAQASHALLRAVVPSAIPQSAVAARALAPGAGPAPAPIRERVWLRAAGARPPGAPEVVIVPAAEAEAERGVIGWRVEERLGRSGERFAAAVLRRVAPASGAGAPSAGDGPLPEGVAVALTALGADASRTPLAARERDLWLPSASRRDPEADAAGPAADAGPLIAAAGAWRHGSGLGELIGGAVEEASALRSRLIGTA